MARSRHNCRRRFVLRCATAFAALGILAGCTSQPSVIATSTQSKTPATPTKSKTPATAIAEDTAWEARVLTNNAATVWRQGQLIQIPSAANKDAGAQAGTYKLYAACEGTGEVTVTLTSDQETRSQTIACGPASATAEVTVTTPQRADVLSTVTAQAGAAGTMVWRLDRT
jgi:hypothetical protein